MLVRALLAYKRSEPRVCAMIKAPTPEEEDRRRLCRERKVLIVERVRHVNRVKGLLFSQGISGYEPLRRDRRRRLDTLQTGDGRLLSVHLRFAVNSIGWNCCSSRSRRWKLSGMCCLPRNKSQRLRRRRCCSISRASGRSSPPSSGRKGCSDTSTIDAKSLLMRA